MSRQFTQDVSLEIAQGNLTGITHVNKFGRNTDIDSSIETVWDGGGVWVAPTTARLHDITSTSASDDGAPVGVGAQTIRVFGLTGWGTAETSEDIIMNGVANVPTVSSYVIIHRMRVLTKGASGPNVGVITATAQTDGTVTAQINAMEGQTQMAIYGIPSTQTAYMTGYYSSANKSGGSGSGGIDANLSFNPTPDTELVSYLIKHTQGLNYSGTTWYRHEFNPYAKFAGPGIIKIDAIGSSVNNDISSGFDLILIDN